MADFRKMLFVLAGLLIFISSASAQTGVIYAAVVAVRPIVWQEGSTLPHGNQRGVQTPLYINAPVCAMRQLYMSSSAITSDRGGGQLAWFLRSDV